MFSFAITGKGEGVLQKIPFSHTKEKAGRMEKE